MKQGWEIKKLGEVCTIERGGSPRPIQAYITESDDGINWIKIGDATDGSKYITSTKEKIKPEGMKKSRFVHKGDFILSNSMSFGRPYILAVDGCIHDGWLVIHDDSNRFDKNYLYYYLGSPNIYNEFKRLAVGGVVNNLNSELVRSVNVCIPPREEQERIVEELDCLSGVIEKKREQLKQLDALAQSIFFQMCGDPISNEKGWEVIPLKQAALLKAGKAIKANELSEESNFGLYPCYGGNGIRGYINKKSHNGLFPIIGRQGALCGNVVFAQGEFYATEHAVVCNNIIDSINPLWLYYALRYNNLNRYAQGVAQPGISVNIINEMPLIYPSLSLQQEFADKIEAIEKQKELIKKSISETETLFNARMDYYFN